MTLRIDLLTRPFSCHRPRVKGYEPTIRCKVERVGRGRLGWRSTTYVDDRPLATSHHATKAKAEDAAAKMMEAYTEVHYFSV